MYSSNKIAYIPDDEDANSLVTTINCKQGNDCTLNIVSQLSHGDCEGEVPPEPLTPIAPTANFSDSNYFSETNYVYYFASITL